MLSNVLWSYFPRRIFVFVSICTLLRQLNSTRYPTLPTLALIHASSTRDPLLHTPSQILCVTSNKWIYPLPQALISLFILCPIFIFDCPASLSISLIHWVKRSPFLLETKIVFSFFFSKKRRKVKWSLALDQELWKPCFKKIVTTYLGFFFPWA